MKQLEQKESKVRLRIQEMSKMQNNIDEEKNCDVNDNIEEKVDFTEDVGENTDERKVVRNYETEGNLSTLKPCKSQVEVAIYNTAETSNSQTKTSSANCITYPSMVTH